MKESIIIREDVLDLLRAAKPNQIKELITGGRGYSIDELVDEIKNGTDFGRAVYFKLEAMYDTMTGGGVISRGGKFIPSDRV